ncbi:hypothetical protein L7F22_020989 [Adiantum nelumboides]|nr:hypothetical protein [Adiantum nelumboides]
MPSKSKILKKRFINAEFNLWDDCTHKEGHVRYNFTLVFHFLRHHTPFEDAISETLQMGNNTDTNAIMVGGFLGAFHDVQAIRPFMKDPVLNYNCFAKVGRVRPLLFCPKNIHELMAIIRLDMNDSLEATATEL